jgi:hypothetical protein
MKPVAAMQIALPSRFAAGAAPTAVGTGRH